MSEKFQDGFDFDDAFESLTGQLADDPTYVKDIEDVNDQLDEHDVRSLFALRQNDTDPKGPYYTVAIEHRLQEVVDGFQEYCRHIGVSPLDRAIPDYAFDQIFEHVVSEIYSIHKDLAPGDTISATRAIVIDTDEDYAVEIVGEGQRIQGEFIGATIGNIPDDVSVLTLNEFGATPLGVGIVVKNPYIIEDDGTRHEIAHDDKQIIIALGSLGLKVEKLYYQIDHLFVTPPDDTPSH